MKHSETSKRYFKAYFKTRFVFRCCRSVVFPSRYQYVTRYPMSTWYDKQTTTVFMRANSCYDLVDDAPAICFLFTCAVIPLSRVSRLLSRVRLPLSRIFSAFAPTFSTAGLVICAWLLRYRCLPCLARASNCDRDSLLCRVLYMCCALTNVNRFII